MKSLLFLASTWPEPLSSAAGMRTLQLLDLFLEENWQVTVMCAAGKRPHSAVLPEEIQTLPLVLNDSSADQIFADLHPDMVIFDRFMLEEQYGWRITASCPNALRVLDSIDLHCLREIRWAALKENRPREFKDWFCDTAMRELAAIHRSDLTILISDAEYEIITREIQIPGSLLTVLPFLLRPEECEMWCGTPGFAQRKDFISIGNFRHPPNADSVRHLYRDIWPMLHQRCPGAQLKIYGADLTPALRQLHQPAKGFHVCGRAENALQVMKEARVSLAPLRFGAGLKGKLLDAMLAGTPSVTTPVGAEGMQGTCAWPGAVEVEPDAFAEAAARFYEDESTWETARNFIPPLLHSRFSREKYRAPFLQKIHSLLSPEIRFSADRITGALLRHHQHRSTEYMSRWIEAKNK